MREKLMFNSCFFFSNVSVWFSFITYLTTGNEIKVILILLSMDNFLLQVLHASIVINNEIKNISFLLKFKYFKGDKAAEG